MLAELQVFTDLLNSWFSEAQRLLQDLSTEQLNWRPLVGETREQMSSSLYGLALHTSFVAMRGAANAGNRTLENYPELVQGNNGIESISEGAERALALLEEARLFVRDVASSLTESELEEMRQRRFGSVIVEPKSVRWLLWHVLEHTALHIGQMELTRQLALQATHKRISDV